MLPILKSFNRKITIEEFKQIILKTIFGEHEVEEYHLTDDDWKKIKQLSNENTEHGNGITVETLNIILKENINLSVVLYK